MSRVEPTSMNKVLSYLRLEFNDKVSLVMKRNLESFYQEYKLTEIHINDDGLCFINAIQEFHKRILSIDITVDKIKSLIKFYFLENQIPIYEGLSDNEYTKQLEIELNIYFVEKNYQRDFVDYIINSAAAIFKTDIYILNTQTLMRSNKRTITVINYLKSNHSVPTSKAIIMTRECYEDGDNQQCYHYNLIVNQIIDENNKTEDKFENGFFTCNSSSSDSDSDLNTSNFFLYFSKYLS